VVDAVVNATGFAWTPALVPALAAAAGGAGSSRRLPAMTPAFESRTVPGLYFCGCLTGALHPAAASVHGWRYFAQCLARLLEWRHHGEAWPLRARHAVRGDRAASAAQLAAVVLERASENAALWHLHGCLCEVFVIDGGEVRHYDTIPAACLAAGAKAHPFSSAAEYFTVSLEYPAQLPAAAAGTRGDCGGDGSGSDCGGGGDGTCRPAADARDDGLCPVVRAFRNGAQVAELRLPATPQWSWTDERLHRTPVTAFLAPLLRMKTRPACPAEFVGCEELREEEEEEEAAAREVVVGFPLGSSQGATLKAKCAATTTEGDQSEVLACRPTVDGGECADG